MLHKLHAMVISNNMFSVVFNVIHLNRGGLWNSGGSCKEATKPLETLSASPSEKIVIAEEVIKKMRTPITFLNITGLSEYRVDGHPSIYGRKSASGSQDCSHWCLPGIPDVWNELLYAHLQ